MPKDKTFALTRQAAQEVLLAATLKPAALRAVQRRAQAGELQRVHAGVYLACGASAQEIESCVKRNWQRIAGAIAPGGVVSHISAFTSGILADGTLTLSHPTNYRRTVKLPGLSLVLLQGPGPLPNDLALADSGLYWSSRTRMLLENLGRKSARKVGRESVERYLVEILNAAGEPELNKLRDEAAGVAQALSRPEEEQSLRTLIGALLGTHQRGELRTQEGKLVAQGMPVDSERMFRFEALAACLRNTALPVIVNSVPAGVARHNFAFIESYFSNYVEGTKFDIEVARDIVMHNKVIPTRPKDSHDILGVFRLASQAPYRNSPPVAGEDFLAELQTWHVQMLSARPEVQPGKTKLEANYAGDSKFVEPGMVRGTMQEGSKLALSVPEGLARGIYYAFLVSEVHPFNDGNGRISRLLLNAELSRVGLHRVIIPTLFHPQYVDCARLLTQKNQPGGFVASIVKMAKWCSQFDFGNLDLLIAQLKATNALQESPVQFRLLNLDGTQLAS